MKHLAFSRILSRFALGAISVVAASWSSHANAQAAVTVVEYYNKTIAAYFLTGRLSEQGVLDAQPDFARTGVTFAALSADTPPPSASGLDSVCRYRISVPTAGYSSHFYGLSADCATVAAAGLANFSNEGVDFAITRPVSGTCPAAAPIAVYRNLRKLTPVDIPNHRYSTSLAKYNEMLTRGWSGEGVVFCTTSASQEPPRPIVPTLSSLEDRCAVPRSGASPYTGPYTDRPGTLDDEKSALRALQEHDYLWYREVPSVSPASFATPVEYFSALLAPTRVPSGKFKDRFSFTMPTADYEQLVYGGSAAGYGISWKFGSSTPPRKLEVAIVTPGSTAALAGVKRGDFPLFVDGVDVINGSDRNALNRGLFPTAIGQAHRIIFKPADGSANRDLVLTSANTTIVPVPASTVLATDTGKVGYLHLTTFSTDSSEAALVSSITALQAAGVTDLVLDLRYNGGGRGDISAELAYMIAGPARTNGKTYLKDRFNDKLPFGIFGSGPADVITPFLNTAQGPAVAPGTALPTLNLGRVFVLTSGNSCSASEAVISGLRGVDVDVQLIGGTTCGKPYGFYPYFNCGMTYFSIQISGTNDKGEGDYVDGFAPTCAAADDVSRALGDPLEGQLSAALKKRATGVCAPVAVAVAAEHGKRVASDANADDDSQALRPPVSANDIGLIMRRGNRDPVAPRGEH